MSLERLRTVLSVLAFVLICAGAWYVVQRPLAPRYACEGCNVLLISLDSVRADRVGLISGGGLTPNIDAFFRNGVLFEDFITASYLTPISEMALHTGLYPATSGVVGFGSLLPSTTPMLAERLEQAGFDTVAFGTSPEFFSFLPAMERSFSRGFNSYFERSRAKAEPPAVYSLRQSPPDDAAEWLSARKGDDGKFFAWVALGTAHFPYTECPEDGYDGFLKDRSLHWNNDTLRRIYDGAVWSLETAATRLRDLSAADAAHIRSCYDGNIALADEYVGRILAALEKGGLADTTIVLLASEHGEDMGEHGTFLHYDIYDESIHTPLLIRYPGNPRLRVSVPVGSVDVLPTILELLGLARGAASDGESLVPLMKGEVREEPYAISVRAPLWENGIGDAPTLQAVTSDRFEDAVFPAFLRELPRLRHESRDVPPDIAIVTERWKLIWRRSREIESRYSWWGALTGTTRMRPEFELYDRQRDPAEGTDLLDQHPDVADALKRRLSAWTAEHESPARPVNELPIQPYF